MQRDNFRCQMCGSFESTLHIHHISYNTGNPWEIHDNALITLCEDCHEHETEAVKDEAKDLIKVLKGAGMMSVDFKALSAAFLNCNRVLRYRHNVEALVKMLTDDKYWEMAENEIEIESKKEVKKESE